MTRTKLDVAVQLPGDGLRHSREAAQARRTGLLFGVLTSKLLSSEFAVQRRRGVPIMAYVGPNGGGKTLCMVNDTLPSLDAGRTVYSTVPLYDVETGEPHPAYRPFTRWSQLLEAEHADFLMDEVIGIASSRESSSMHAEVQNRLNQLRKADVVLRWTAPSWARADKIIREVTQAVTECRGYMSDGKATREPGAGGQVALWAPRRLFRFRTFDMRDFDEWSAGKRDRVRADVKQWFQGPGSRAFGSYRTLDSVERIEAHDPNKCPQCGGQLRREYCKGH